MPGKRWLIALGLLTIFGLGGGYALVDSFLRGIYGGGGSIFVGILSLTAVFASSVAWIVHIDRYGAENWDPFARGIILLFLIGVAVLSGLILVVGLFSVV